ncbi:MAG: NUDIX domain-containing protein [Rubrobacteraceae bacterium]
MDGEHKFPIPIKGVLLNEDGAVFLRNEREEWELPGGKLELGESSEKCLVREVKEELGIPVTVGPILDSWAYEVCPGTRVFIVTYGCFAEDLSTVRHSHEHQTVGLFGLDELESLNAPQGYKNSVWYWFEMIGRDFPEQS